MAVPTQTVECATCKGTGLHTKFLCEACDSKGKVEVESPAKPCPLCYGSGTSGTGPLRFSSPICAACGGAGWARLISASGATH